MTPPAWLVVFASGAALATLVTWLVLRPRRVEHWLGLEQDGPRHRWGRIVQAGVYDWEGEG